MKYARERERDKDNKVWIIRFLAKRKKMKEVENDL
jgi:hypothetical protein